MAGAKDYCGASCLVLLGFLCAAPLLLLPSNLGIPGRAAWTDATHLHENAARPEGVVVAAAVMLGGRQAAVVEDDVVPRLHHICKDADSRPPPGVKYDVMGKPGSSTDTWAMPVCHWAVVHHAQVPLRPFNMCTHDPTTDKVISLFLHLYGFWDSPDTHNTLLAAGPCTPERPYMLDIGANLGLWTLVSVSQGCKAVAFEPLSANILRLRESLRRMGKEDDAILYKHAAGKAYGEVSINFFASNPGASSLGGSKGATTESMGALAVDGLLLGDPALRPIFPGGPPIIGKYIAWAKIDTEGWDTAVLDGAMRTLLGGQVPIIMIEFSPGDSRGTAGCDPIKFVQLMYANGYRMYQEGGAIYRLKQVRRGARAYLSA
jgi:hypothetical protein